MIFYIQQDQFFVDVVFVIVFVIFGLWIRRTKKGIDERLDGINKTIAKMK
jgi:uncharacterized protein YoxC